MNERSCRTTPGDTAVVYKPFERLDTGMTAKARIREYYEALERGEPLFPFFAERDGIVKHGIQERLVGYDEIAEGLREQGRTTDDWRVDSRALRTVGGSGWAHFSDEVGLSWRRRTEGDRVTFDTRWSGSLEQISGEWLFVGMHVSVPTPIDDGSEE